MGCGSQMGNCAKKTTTQRASTAASESTPAIKVTGRKSPSASVPRVPPAVPAKQPREPPDGRDDSRKSSAASRNIERPKLELTDHKKNRPWNAEFQAILDKIDCNSEDAEVFAVMQQLEELHSQFLKTVKDASSTIIAELGVRADLKTIHPCLERGVPVQFIYHNICFKLAPSDNGRGMADAAQEFRAFLAYVPFLHRVRYTLACRIDWRGYRILASAEVPSSKLCSELVYGSFDGKTVCASDADINQELESICSHLGLLGHFSSVPFTEHTYLFSPGDVRVFRGTDGRDYVDNFARVLPSEPPMNQNTPITQYSVNTFRPEFLQNFTASPLSCDVYIPTSDACHPSRRTPNYREITNEALVRLFKVEIPNFARDTMVTDPAGFSIRHHMHVAGINMRYLGLVRAHTVSTTLRMILLVEMVARLIKADFRAILQKVSGLCEQDYKVAACEFLNKVFGISGASRDYWIEMYKKLVAKFMFWKGHPALASSPNLSCLNQEESAHATKTDLRSVVVSKLGEILKRVNKMMGVELSTVAVSSYASVLDNAVRAGVGWGDSPFRVDQLIVLACKLRGLKLPFFRGMKAAIRANELKQNDAATAEALRKKACTRFQHAAKIYPLDWIVYACWGHVLHLRADVQKQLAATNSTPVPPEVALWEREAVIVSLLSALVSPDRSEEDLPPVLTSLQQSLNDQFDLADTIYKTVLGIFSGPVSAKNEGDLVGLGQRLRQWCEERLVESVIIRLSMNLLKQLEICFERYVNAEYSPASFNARFFFASVLQTIAVQTSQREHALEYYQKAEEQLATIVEDAAPDVATQARAHAELGHLYEHMDSKAQPRLLENLQKPARQYRLAAELMPEAISYWLSWGTVLRECVELSPDVATAEENIQQAVSKFERALTIDPAHTPTLIEWSNMYWERARHVATHDLAQSEQWFLKAIDICGRILKHNPCEVEGLSVCFSVYTEYADSVAATDPQKAARLRRAADDLFQVATVSNPSNLLQVLVAWGKLIFHRASKRLDQESEYLVLLADEKFAMAWQLDTNQLEVLFTGVEMLREYALLVDESRNSSSSPEKFFELARERLSEALAIHPGNVEITKELGTIERWFEHRDVSVSAASGATAQALQNLSRPS